VHCGENIKKSMIIVTRQRKKMEIEIVTHAINQAMKAIKGIKAMIRAHVWHARARARA
jgi:stage V sporulation protein SpoVS